MSKTFSPIALHPPQSFAAFETTRSRLRAFDGASLEREMARAFDVIRDCARIAWWDGSSVGLQLHGILGLFDGLDANRGDRP